MKEYLIWVNFGGENGSPNRMQDYYRICKGITEADAVYDWAKQNDIPINEMKASGDSYYHYGRDLSVVKLIKDNGYDDWKTIEWVNQSK